MDKPILRKNCGKNYEEHADCKYNEHGLLEKDESKKIGKTLKAAEGRCRQHIEKTGNFAGVVKGDQRNCPENVNDFGTEFHDPFKFLEQLEKQSEGKKKK